MELKPIRCPFCGGEATFKRNEPGSESCKVICVACLGRGACTGYKRDGHYCVEPPSQR